MISAIVNKFEDPDLPTYGGRTTDMLVVMSLHKDSPDRFYNIDQKVVSGFKSVDNELPWEEKCHEFEGFYGIHFSHDTLVRGKQKGIFPESMEASERVSLATDILKTWAKECDTMRRVIT